MFRAFQLLRRPGGQRALLITATCTWAVGVTLAFGFLWSYASTPGSSAQVPEAWPADATISRSDGAMTLVMGLHPRCPCSDATIAELARVLTWCEPPVDVKILAVLPSGAAAGFDNTPLIRKAAALRGVSIIADHEGKEAQKFGITTSGHVLLFDADGRQRFSGGITAARGHQGDNAGSEALIRLLTGRPSPSPTTPVFGCSVSTPAIETDAQIPSAASGAAEDTNH
jgi:hypothetical protein